jgi:hypothetical protein
MKTTTTTEPTHRRIELPAALRRAVGAALIASAVLFAAPDLEAGSAHTVSPCTGWQQAHQMTLRQPSMIRFRGSPGPMVSRLYCRVRPGDPIHVNYAGVARANV